MKNVWNSWLREVFILALAAAVCWVANQACATCDLAKETKTKFNDHEATQKTDMEKINKNIDTISENVIKVGKAVARIEGKLEK